MLETNANSRTLTLGHFSSDLAEVGLHVHSSNGSLAADHLKSFFSLDHEENERGGLHPRPDWT